MLTDTIPRQTYTMNDPNFTMPTTGLYYTAIMWGFEYQRTLTDIYNDTYVLEA